VTVGGTFFDQVIATEVRDLGEQTATRLSSIAPAST
jgi:hypothetical protein